MIGSSRKYRNFWLVSILLLTSVFIIFNTFIIDYFLSKSSDCIVKEEKIIYPNVVFLGDSITEVYDLDEFYDEDEIVVINSGYSGNTSADILKNLKKRVLQYKPSKIFLLIGTNDIGFGKDLDMTIENIKKIILEIEEKLPKAELYVESIYPINSTLDGNKVGRRTNEAIRRVNREIEDFCLQNETKYLDVYSVLADDGDNLKIEYTIDGLHLSHEGYEVVSEVLKMYVLKV